MSFYDAFNTPPVTDGSNVIPIGTASPTKYGTGALRDEAQRVAEAAEGTRNHTLNRAAFRMGQLVSQGLLTEQQVEAELTTAAHSAGLGRTETAKSIRSGLRAGTRSGRDKVELRPETPEPVIGVLDPAEINGTPVTGTDDETGDEGRARTSWWPEPLPALATEAARAEPPNVLVRSDGQSLFYPGKVNGLLGESESGKTWVGIHAVHQSAAEGHLCLVLDFEDTPITMRDRLELLGASPETLARIHYANPDQALDIVAAEDFNEALTHGYRVILVDGMNAAMTLLGLDLNSNTDATQFAVKILRPMAKSGAAVITIDHVPKSIEARGKGGIGAQAKRAMMDGCAIRVEVDEPFGKGRNGSLKLWIDKDRPGVVRGLAGGGRLAGTASIVSTDDRVYMAIEADEAAGQSWRPTNIMDSIMKLLEDLGEASKNRIENEVRGKRDTIRAALDALVDDGLIERSSGVRNSIIYRPRPTSPDLARGEVVKGDPRHLAPLPFRGGAGAKSPHREGEATNTDSWGEVTNPCRRCGQVNTPLDRGYCPECE